MIRRISQVFNWRKEELDIDESIFENLHTEYDDPMFLAAEILKETLLNIGMDEESGEVARKTFLCLKNQHRKKKANSQRLVSIGKDIEDF